MPNDRHSCFCIPCGKKIRCGHQGLTDIKKHCDCDSHKRNVTEANKNNISQFFTNSNETSKAVTKAEVMVTNFLVQHNLPPATAGHMGPLLDVQKHQYSSTSKGKVCGVCMLSSIPVSGEHICSQCICGSAVHAWCSNHENISSSAEFICNFCSGL